MQESLECKLLDFSIFRAVKFFGFVSYGVVLYSLANQVNEIECFSRIDRKIKGQYRQTLRMVRFVLYFQIVMQLILASYA